MAYLKILGVIFLIYLVSYNYAHSDYTADPDCNISVCRP